MTPVRLEKSYQQQILYLIFLILKDHALFRALSSELAFRENVLLVQNLYTKNLPKAGENTGIFISSLINAVYHC